MNILGLSAYYHDSAAALIKDGEIVAAAQEERFTRIKNDERFPANALKFCLNQGGITMEDIDNIVFYEKPFLKFERLLETYTAFAPKGFSSFARGMPIWLKEKLFQRQNLIKEIKKIEPRFKGEKKLLFNEHHISHAASAFYPSPFDEAIILTMDGVGEWATTSVSIGRDNQIDLKKEIYFPHSIGLLYSAFTYYLGFKVNSGEYKVMGLAPYGKPLYADLILEKLVDLKSDGSYFIDQSYFSYCTGLTMTNRLFNDLFGGAPRRPEEPLTQRHMDLAASIQKVTEQMVLTLARALKNEYEIGNLCLAGGVALNCVANGLLRNAGLFDDIWVQPAAGDAGGALGAALSGFYQFHGKNRQIFPRDSMRGSLLGPSFDDAEIELALNKYDLKAQKLSETEIVQKTAQALNQENVIGWFQGAMEFGPRALGSRSILADPRAPGMQRRVNSKIKNRENFRPFAPAILESEVAGWFKTDKSSPYMQFVEEVHESKRRQMTEEQARLRGLEMLDIERSSITAVTHVDFTSRLQTVSEDRHPVFHQLLTSFFELTDCPVLLNTSFNVRGEPIVCTPEDAVKCFLNTEMDALAIGTFYVEKSEG